MSLYDLLLFVHVLGAFTLIAGQTAMAPFALSMGERIGSARLAGLGAILSNAGATVALGIGLWLVANVGYELLRFWIIGAIMLFGVAGFCNGKVARAARLTRDGEEPGPVPFLWAVDLMSSVLILVLMVWKPGH